MPISIDDDWDTRTLQYIYIYTLLFWMCACSVGNGVHINDFP